MPDVSLEYYVKFPNANFVYERQLKIDVEHVPVVVLFGWTGCQDKYLAKYSEIYEKRGLITLRYIAPLDSLFWARHRLPIIGEKLIKLLDDLNLNAHPLILHCFSNGGAAIYQHFSAALTAPSAPQLQIKGVIFDSAPGKRRVRSLYRAISAIVGGNYLANHLVSFILTALICLMWLFETLRNYIEPNTYHWNVIEYLKRETNMWPQHVLYSYNDDLIPHEDIEEFIAHRRAVGVDVSCLSLQHTEHVKHYFSHYKDTYANSVWEFIHKVLQM